MTDRIPESVWKEARRISFEIGKPGDGLSTKTIARALLARDQRAAEIVRKSKKEWEANVEARFEIGMVGCIRATRSDEAEFIADAILSYDEAQQ